MEKEKIKAYLNEPLFSAVENRSKRQQIDIHAFVENAVEKEYLYPFFSEKHLRNYYYIKNKALKKEDSINRQVLFYIIAYDGIYMEHFDGIYKVVNNKEVVSIPKELNDILHPGFCLIDAACEFFQNGTIKNMHNSFKWFKYDDNEMLITLNAIAMMKGVISIDDELYSPELFDIDIDEALSKEYTMDGYLQSEIFGYYNDLMKELIKELFDKLKDNDIDVKIEPCEEDELTFSLITGNGKRLAVVSSSDDGANLRIGINKWKNGTHGNMLYCDEIKDIGIAVKDDKVPDSDLLTKYKELI